MTTSPEQVPKRERIVGKSVERVDTRDKARGKAMYASDMKVEGMLFGAVVRADVPHAKIECVDASDALAMAGVECVIDRSELLGGYDDHVRHYGDVVAAVAADSLGTAREAATRVSVDLDHLEYVEDPREAVREDAPTVHGDDPQNFSPHDAHDIDVQNDEWVKNIDDYHSLSIGDAEAGLAQADVVHQNQYVTPRVKHCNLDTNACIAEWRGEELRLIDSVTAPDDVQATLAKLMDVDPDRIRVEVPETPSSSFGANALVQPSLELVAVSLADATDRPVKLWFDRQEEFVATDHRHAVHFDVAMGMTDDGEFTALDISAVADTGAYPNHIGHIVLMNCKDRALELYDIPNYEFEGVAAFTNNLIPGEYRGIGSTQIGYVLDRHVEELAREADLDPLEVRRRNFVEEGHIPPNTGLRINSCGLEECVARGHKRFEVLSQGKSDDPDVLTGWGVSAATHTTGPAMTGDEASQARITVRSDGSVVVDCTAVDQGQGSDTVLGQMVSEELGIPLERIEVSRVPTTDDLDGDMGSVAARTTWIVGNAVKKATENLREALQDQGGRVLDEDPANVEVVEERVFGGGNSITIEDLLRELNRDEIVATGRVTSKFRPPGYGVHFVEVQIDRQTGHVKIPTYVAAQDVGYAINPRMVEGQLEGAVQHGTEFALYSEIKLEGGAPVNANLADYPVITPFEMPERLVCEIVESNETDGPYGAKGVGTPAQPPVAPAILNAVRDATGVAFTDPPIETEEIFVAVNGDN